MSFHVPNRFRIRKGRLASTDDVGNAGAFIVPPRKVPGMPLTVVASDGEGWEHVSVSLPDRCPTWAEMCRVKDLFWDAEDCVVQFHPPLADNINDYARPVVNFATVAEAVDAAMKSVVHPAQPIREV